MLKVGIKRKHFQVSLLEVQLGSKYILVLLCF